MRILIADDHPLYREAVVTQIKRLYPEAQIDEASSLDEARELSRKHAGYDIFLFDFSMPGMSVDAAREFVEEFPRTPLAVISGTAKPQDARSVILAGARGFVPKTITSEHLAHTLQLLLAGGTSVPAELLQPAESDETMNSATPWLPLLTRRELEVLKGVVKGLSNKEIGRELNLAEVTIKLHLRSIFRKIGARGRAEAAVIATKAGIT